MSKKSDYYGPGLEVEAGIMLHPLHEKRRVNGNNNRAQRRGQRADLSPTEWMVILILHRFRCAYCGRPFETMDHIVPIANGGGTTFTNVVPACSECNNRKGAAVWL